MTMTQLIARSALAITLGIVFLIAMLVALASDALGGAGRRRQQATQSRRNRPQVAWS
jgi:hypothetical protein